MKQAVILLTVAVMITLYLGSGAMAFNSPLDENSPIGIATSTPDQPSNSAIPSSEDTPTAVPPTPTMSNGPIYEYVSEPEPMEIIATPILFIPVSPLFHSPIPTPEYLCVAVGMSSKYILCYEVIP